MLIRIKCRVVWSETVSDEQENPPGVDQPKNLLPLISIKRLESSPRERKKELIPNVSSINYYIELRVGDVVSTFYDFISLTGNQRDKIQSLYLGSKEYFLENKCFSWFFLWLFTNIKSYNKTITRMLKFVIKGSNRYFLLSRRRR